MVAVAHRVVETLQRIGRMFNPARPPLKTGVFNVNRLENVARAPVGAFHQARSASISSFACPAGSSRRGLDKDGSLGEGGSSRENASQPSELGSREVDGKPEGRARVNGAAGQPRHRWEARRGDDRGEHESMEQVGEHYPRRIAS